MTATIKRSRFVPVIFYTAVILLLHIFMYENQGLDTLRYFAKALDKDSLFGFLSMRWETWSSRLIIEGVLAFFSRYLILFKLVSTAVFLVMLLSLSSILNPEKKTKIDWILAGVLLLYPFSELSSAGWGATILNYVWPLSFGLYALSVAVKGLRKERIRLYEAVLVIPAILYAANMEQMAGLLFLLLLAMIVLCVTEKRVPPAVLLLEEALVTGMLIFILTCPGNSVRASQEIAISEGTRDFLMLSFPEKLSLGISETVRSMVTNNLPVLFLTIVLLILTFLKQKKLLTAVLPGLALLLILRSGDLGTFFPSLKSFLKADAHFCMENYMTPAPYLSLFLCMLFPTLLLCTILLLSDSSREAFMLSAIFVTGILTHIILGFSPTLYSSAARTMIYLDHSVLVIAAYLVIRNLNGILIHKKASAVMAVGFVTVSAGSILSSLYAVAATR